MATKKKSPKPATKSYTLIQDVTTSNGVFKKGEKVSLTEEGRLFFKSKKRIE